MKKCNHVQCTYPPAEAHEQCVVGFRPELDSAQQSHGRVDINVLGEVHHVQIFYGNPPEDGAAECKQTLLFLVLWGRYLRFIWVPYFELFGAIFDGFTELS